GLFHCRGKRGFCRGSAKSAYPATDEIMGVPEIGATTGGFPDAFASPLQKMKQPCPFSPV
ncbi:MAG: hypothetical protein WBC69_20720, partial [Geitlerinemataceae cyanobacterium]